jgi:ATPase subunit of ABC transporter with duplicated ATPase domains
MGLPKIILGGRKRQAQISLGKIQSEEHERDQQRAAEFQDLVEKQKQSSQLRLDFSLGIKPKGKVIFSLENFNCRYVGSEFLLWQEPLNFTLHAGDRLVIRGENGSGKSTLLKILTGALGSEKCECFGHFSQILRKHVYLDQAYSLANNKQNIIDNMMEDSRFDHIETRNRLADYGFTKEDVFKAIGVLSGGERLKVCLAKLAFSLKTPEVWILDEPTNNLDLESLEILEAALMEYDGTLIVVSHDERFIERIQCEQEMGLVSAKKDRGVR